MWCVALWMSYGPTCWLDHYDTHAILCAGYYTPLHTTNLKASCQMHFIARSQVHSWLHSIAHSQPAWLYTPNCSRWHTPSLLDLRSQVSSQDAPKYTPGHALNDAPISSRWHTSQPAWLTLSSKLSRHSQVHSRACSQRRSQLLSMAHSNLAWLYALKMLSSTLPRMLSRMLPTALDCTLPACLTVRSQVSSQDTPKYTSQSLSSTLPIALDGTLPISPDCMLPCMLLHAQSRDLLSCRRQAPGGVRLGVYGRQYLVGGGRRVECGMWQVACGVCWPKSWRRLIV